MTHADRTHRDPEALAKRRVEPQRGSGPEAAWLELQRSAGNRAVARLLQRQVTDQALIGRIRDEATTLAGTVIAAPAVAAARDAVIAKHANDTDWAVIEADLKAALAGRHVLQALLVPLGTTSTPPTYGDAGRPYHVAAGTALAQVAALATDRAKVAEWTGKLASTLGVAFMAQIRLPVIVQSALEGAQAQSDLATTMSQHEAVAQIPGDQAWKLLMDGDKQADRGRFGFENEKGYMAGMMRGLKLMLESLAQPFTADLYERLHDKAVEGVVQRDKGGEQFQPKFRHSIAVSFGGELGKTFTADGLLRLRQSHDWDDWFQINAALQVMPGDIVELKHLSKTREECKAKVQSIVERYNEEIVGAEGQDAKLRTILRCCQDLELAHTFTDGNLRTTAFLVLNRLLIQNGMSATILGEPNNLDGHTIDQLIPQVLEGQQRVAQL